MKQQKRDSGEVMRVSFLALWLLATLGAVHATEFLVGGQTGWRMPPNGNTDFYDNWSEQQNVRVHDTLRFKYSSQLHDVLEVSEADYDSCIASTPIQRFNSGDTAIEMTRSGTWYFICGFPNHCDGGQKLSVDVHNASLTGSTAPSSSPSSSSSSSSNSTSAAGISREFSRMEFLAAGGIAFYVFLGFSL